MRDRTTVGVSRRRFIGGTFAFAGTLPLAPLAAATVTATNSAVAGNAPVSGYRCLDAAEAAFVEAMVNARCPADTLTPNGVASGLAAFIDAYLAGDTAGVHGSRELFRAGLAAADSSCRERFGMAFHELDPSDARQFLRDMAAGDVDADFPLASWRSDVVEPLLTQACFSGVVYERHGGRMFWKLFG